MKVARPKRLLSFLFFFLKLLNQIFICNSTECAKSFVFLAHVQITGGAVECAALAGWQRNRLLELWTMQHSIKVWYLYFKYTHTQRYTHTVNNQSLQTMCKDFFLKELSKGLPQSASGERRSEFRNRDQETSKNAQHSLTRARTHTPRTRYATQPTRPPTPLFSHRWDIIILAPRRLLFFFSLHNAEKSRVRTFHLFHLRWISITNLI